MLSLGFQVLMLLYEKDLDFGNVHVGELHKIPFQYEC